ncbi:hypothetical protein [Oceanimonas smirnovii]|uniref:hypothetical protein n=1 Tax=Oceanimonas smirnovii TaxID=264574 RepID=UPI003FD19439
MFLWKKCNNSAGLKALHTMAVAVLSTVMLILSVPAYANHPGPATTTLSVQPTFMEGNPTCSDVSNYMEYKINDVVSGSFTAPDGTKFTINVYPDSGGQAFDWSVAGGVVWDIVVKGGPNANHYDYNSQNPAAKADTYLHSPVNHKNNKFYGLSHISFCYEPGAPAIEITKVCDGGSLSGSTATYNYTATISNTGTVKLTDIKVMESGDFDSCMITGFAGDPLSDYIKVADSLDVGNDDIELVITCTSSKTGLENHIMVRASYEDGVVDDDATAACEFASNPSVSVDKFCPLKEVETDTGFKKVLESVRLEQKGNDTDGYHLVVKVCPEIVVTNNGPENLDVVIVKDESIPALKDGVDLITKLGSDMLPGQTEYLSNHYDLCYYPDIPETVTGGEFDGMVEAVASIEGLEGEYATAIATFFNSVTVNAKSVFGGLAPRVTDTTFHWDTDNEKWIAECPLCLPCPECEKNGDY